MAEQMMHTQTDELVRLAVPFWAMVQEKLVLTCYNSATTICRVTSSFAVRSTDCVDRVVSGTFFLVPVRLLPFYKLFLSAG